ncbi:MAG: DUF1127 domain-containing protein [Tagaea sp.]|nr:DUF1127 domain-containing protein [Tagaea sp.]
MEQLARLGLDAGVGALRAVDRVLLIAVETLLAWQERATMRTQMAELSDQMRKDMGLTEGDVFREASKPFWVG